MNESQADDLIDAIKDLTKSVDDVGCEITNLVQCFQRGARATESPPVVVQLELLHESLVNLNETLRQR